MNSYRVSVLVALASLSSGQPLAAQSLDQFNIIPPPNLANGAFSFGSFRRLQTVTVGLSGVLSQVDIQYNSIYGTPNLTGFSVYGTGASGVPNAVLLGTGTLSANTGGWASFLTNINVAAGQVIALEPSYIVGGAGWSFNSVTPNSYSRGSGFNGSQGGSFVNENNDYGFRTFVTPSPAVPEPATWAMLIGGFGLIGGTARRARGALVAA